MFYVFRSFVKSLSYVDKMKTPIFDNISQTYKQSILQRSLNSENSNVAGFGTFASMDFKEHRADCWTNHRGPHIFSK